MPTLNEDILRRLLHEHITEDYDVIEIAEFEDETDASGRLMPHRDSLRWRYEGRLARLREVAPNRTDLHDEHAAILRVLEATTPQERLYHWTARSETREYFGVAALRFIVFVHSYSRRPDGRQTRRLNSAGCAARLYPFNETKTSIPKRSDHPRPDPSNHDRRLSGWRNHCRHHLSELGRSLLGTYALAHAFCAHRIIDGLHFGG